jgi:hypothetical protein
MGHLYAGVLGSLAMAVVLLRGMLNSSGPVGTLTTATIALVLFAMIGAMLGHIAQSTIDESVRRKIEQELAARAPRGSRTTDGAT